MPKKVTKKPTTSLSSLMVKMQATGVKPGEEGQRAAGDK